GIVSAGSASGAASSTTPSASKAVAVPYTATRRHGTVFSTAISPATNAIQAMLITPSANSDAINAQQQPTHHAPWPAPMSRTPGGLGHSPRPGSSNGVNS